MDNDVSIRSFLVKRFRWTEILAFVPAIVAIDVAIPLLVMKAVDSIILSNPKHDQILLSYRYHLILKIALIIGSLISIQYGMRRLFLKRQIQRIGSGIADLQGILMNDMIRNAVHLLSVQRVGDMTTHIMTDVRDLRDSVTEIATDIPFAAFSLLGLSVAMVLIHPLLTACLLLSGLVLSVITALITKKGLTKRRQELTSFTHSVTQTITSLGEAQTSARIGNIGQNSALHLHDLEDSFVESYGVEASISPLINAFELVGVVILLVYGGWIVLQGRLSAGALVAFFAYLEMLSEPMMRCANITVSFQRYLIAEERLNGFWKTFRYESSSISAPARRTINLEGAVSVKDLSFSYPNSSSVSLSNLSFTVLPKETVAIVGPNGAGKSTLIDLLLTLFETYQGEIFFDRHEARSLDSQSLRNQIGVVPQELVLLRGTIEHNIVLGSPLKAAKLEDAISIAGVGRFTSDLPDGLSTIIGEGGQSFSGGETQRLAIARVHYRNPKILILDEPTSAIDLEGEKEIVRALRLLCEDRTSLIVSHRGAVFDQIPVDKVLLLDKGKQIAFGTPRELWANFPEYRLILPRPLLVDLSNIGKEKKADHCCQR